MTKDTKQLATVKEVFDAAKSAFDIVAVEIWDKDGNRPAYGSAFGDEPSYMEGSFDEMLDYYGDNMVKSWWVGVRERSLFDRVSLTIKLR